MIELASANKPKNTVSAVKRQPAPVFHVEEVDRELARSCSILLVQRHRGSWHGTACKEDDGFMVFENVDTTRALDFAKAWRSLGGSVSFEPKEFDPLFGRRA